MKKKRSMLTLVAAIAFPVALVLVATGCGLIAEKDLIRIAKVDDEYITRGDLFKHIREMADDKRPVIRIKSDMLRTLNQMIDDKIRIPLGKQLAKEGKIQVSRDLAREVYFQSKGEDGDAQRTLYAMEIPEDGAPNDLVDVYNMTPASIQLMKDIIEQETDFVLERLQADEAIKYLAAMDYQAGDLKPDQASLDREYQLRKSELVTLEWLSFRALRFPTSDPNALKDASEVRQRIDAGEDFDAIIEQYLKNYSASVVTAPPPVIESEIENNPNLTRFRGFWEAASGAQPGGIVGPVYLPEYQQMAVDAQGNTRSVTMPEAYLTLKVLDSKPAAPLTIEEALPQLAPPILVTMKLEELRQEHGVEVYEDRLPDPAAFGSQPQDPFGN